MSKATRAYLADEDGREIVVEADEFGGIRCGGTCWWSRLSLERARRWRDSLDRVIAHVEKQGARTR